NTDSRKMPRLAASQASAYSSRKRCLRISWTVTNTKVRLKRTAITRCSSGIPIIIFLRDDWYHFQRGKERGNGDLKGVVERTPAVDGRDTGRTCPHLCGNFQGGQAGLMQDDASLNFRVILGHEGGQGIHGSAVETTKAGGGVS